MSKKAFYTNLGMMLIPLLLFLAGCSMERIVNWMWGYEPENQINETQKP